MRILRNQRLTLRIALIAVLVAGLFGAWFATSVVHTEAATAGIAASYNQSDWTESLAVVVEQAIEFILGWTH